MPSALLFGIERDNTITHEFCSIIDTIGHDCSVARWRHWLGLVYSSDMSKLFEPIGIRGVTFRNRIGVSPMCQYSSTDGFASDWHLVHLGSRAVGGAGLVIAEATAVEARGRISPGDLGIWKDEHVGELSRIARFVAEHGAVPGIQLAHAGRKASTARPWQGGKAVSDADGGWEVVGPSSLPFSNTYRVPRALSVAEISGIVGQFVAAAERALRAGFRYLEIHAAHGYLLHSFLSPLSNQRNDDYGGSFENRARFVLEVTRALRAVVPTTEHVLGLRLSCSDWVEGGWTSEDTVRLAPLLQSEGIDLIDCSSGGNSTAQQIPVGPGYQVHLAEAVKHATSTAVAAVGLITDAQQAERILGEGKADFVFLARELLRDPYFPLHAARALGEKPSPPEQYARAF